MKLGVWEIADSLTKRASRSRVGLENNLENWIERDPSLISEGLRIVGRQLRLSGSRLDLLGISPEGRWVVIELKARQLYREALVQALDYASILNEVPNDILSRLLSNLDGATQDQVNEMLAGDVEGRDIEVIIVGVGVDSGVERLSGYLSESFGVPIRIITFDVFKMLDGKKILIREITEKPVSKRKRRVYSVDAVEAQASDRGSLELLKFSIQIAEELNLYVRPWQKSLTFNSPQAKSYTLIYVKPKSGNKLKVGYSSGNFANLFPVTEEEVEERLGDNWVTLDADGVGDFLKAVRKLFERIEETEDQS